MALAKTHDIKNDKWFAFRQEIAIELGIGKDTITREDFNKWIALRQETMKNLGFEMKLSISEKALKDLVNDKNHDDYEVAEDDDKDQDDYEVADDDDEYDEDEVAEYERKVMNQEPFRGNAFGIERSGNWVEAFLNDEDE
jgi:hypothetical protein